jgi:hypothetical protein
MKADISVLERCYRRRYFLKGKIIRFLQSQTELLWRLACPGEEIMLRRLIDRKHRKKRVVLFLIATCHSENMCSNLFLILWQSHVLSENNNHLGSLLLNY